LILFIIGKAALFQNSAVLYKGQAATEINYFSAMHWVEITIRHSQGSQKE